MTTIQKLIGVMALIAASTVLTQAANTCPLLTLPKGEDGPGVIGKRYVETGIGFWDEAHTSHNTYGTGISANLPICTGLDLSGGYSYSWFNRDPFTSKQHNLGGSATFYNTAEDGIKPFVSLGLGYTFYDENLDKGWVFANDRKNHHGTDYVNWNATVGAEFPYKWVSVIPTITYNDDMRRTKKSTQSFVYSTEVNTWITPRVGIYASVSYYAAQHISSQTWGGGLGVRVRF